jgi:hypothetical protein
MHYLFFFSAAFNILSPFSVLAVLMIMCHEEVYFGQVCLMFWRHPITEWANLEIWENFCYCTYPFGLHLFSFFSAHDSQVWSFDGVAEFLNTPFAALLLFD